jgi:hypothetical protein
MDLIYALLLARKLKMIPETSSAILCEIKPEAWCTMDHHTDSIFLTPIG